MASGAAYSFECGCCIPPRQTYIRLERPVNRAFHEDDHTPAVRVMSTKQRQRRRQAHGHYRRPQRNPRWPEAQ